MSQDTTNNWPSHISKEIHKIDANRTSNCKKIGIVQVRYFETVPGSVSWSSHHLYLKVELEKHKWSTAYRTIQKAANFSK